MDHLEYQYLSEEKDFLLSGFMVYVNMLSMHVLCWTFRAHDGRVRVGRIFLGINMGEGEIIYLEVFSD